MSKLADDALVGLARRHAAKRGVPASLIYAMIKSESSGHPEAASRKGALGLMQMQGPTAKSLGYSHADMLKPEMAVDAGAAYMDKLIDRFGGDPSLALSGYNAGPTKTRKLGGVVPAAKPYVDKVTQQVTELTGEGQPFHDETEVLPILEPKRLQRSQRIADIVSKIKQAQVDAWHPPLLAPEAEEDSQYGFLKKLF